MRHEEDAAGTASQHSEVVAGAGPLCGDVEAAGADPLCGEEMTDRAAAPRCAGREDEEAVEETASGLPPGGLASSGGQSGSGPGVCIGRRGEVGAWPQLGEKAEARAGPPCGGEGEVRGRSVPQREESSAAPSPGVEDGAARGVCRVVTMRRWRRGLGAAPRREGSTKTWCPH
jgi:hypothetical protein